MDLHSAPEVELLNTTPQKILLHNPSWIQLLQMSQTCQTVHWNCTPQIEYGHYYKCRKQIHSVSAFPSTYPMEKHPNMKLISSYTWKDYCTNMSQIQTKNLLVLVIPKAWKYTVVVEAHDKPGHQAATHTYCLIKHQYYWKGMNKDIRKYIANCTLCCRGKAKIQSYPLQMTEIPEWPFNKIAIDLVTECETSNSGNKHILIIINHLTGWLEAFPIPDNLAETIVSTFINHYLPVHLCPRYILSDNSIEFKNHLIDQVLQQLSIDHIFSTPYHPQSNRKLKVFHNYLKPTLNKLCKKIQQIGTSTSIKFMLATE